VGAKAGVRPTGRYQDNPRWRQPIRRSGRTQARPYARIAGKPWKQGRSTIHILPAGHARALRDALARYAQAARRAGGSARRPARSGRRARADGVDSTGVREWAKAQGIDVKARGRVPAELVVKFKAAATR
jgi:hypothetical protein